MHNDHYLAVLSNRAVQDGRIDEKDMLKLQNDLWLLLAQQTESYTMGDSSSVPVEIAAELLRSICFSIGWYLQENSEIKLFAANLQDLLKASRVKLQTGIQEGEELLRQVVAGAPAVGSRAYQDTLMGLGEFFRNYDNRFFAHEIPGSIDYQLALPVPQYLQGLAYVQEYLRRLLIENRFCSCFATSKIIRLLTNSFPEYRELLVNIYEPVAANALGCGLLHKRIGELDITAEERGQLAQFFRRLARQEVWPAMQKAADQVCRELSINDPPARSYYAETIRELAPRIETAIAAGGWENIFVSLQEEPTRFDCWVRYIDGEPMDDGKLRSLLEQIKACHAPGDKITLVRQQVHSLQDLMEVLNVCFWGSEGRRLLAELDPQELEQLRIYLRQKPAGWQSETGWEQCL